MSVSAIKGACLAHVEFGDCRAIMSGWSAGSVQICVTSPPYFGLRDYGHPGQLGLEPTPDEYVAAMVSVFREVRRVLADDGTLWLNLGDSYARTGGTDVNISSTGKVGNTLRTLDLLPDRKQRAPQGLKPKDLIGIPWRVAFALQADGWYLRDSIIWHKPNPMPESVTDRCTKAHEYIFMLSKSPRYYYDHEAIKEPEVCGRMRGPALHRDTLSTNGNSGLSRRESDGKRNRRNVWTVATRPYKGAHFATFPPALIEPCILAGSPRGGTVLDPFMGSGTTAAVALQHGRFALGCEINTEYAPLIRERLA
jgi:DNA modification methylase